VGGLLVEEHAQTAVQILALSESLARVRAVPRDLVYDKLYFDRFLTMARAKLHEDEFAIAWQAGSKMTVERAIELVLNTVEEM
jgi:hypothetical protein